MIYDQASIILLSSMRMDERDMAAFELQVTEEDVDWVRARIFQYFNITIPEKHYPNYKLALASLSY
jgi:hypothetical protein